MQNRSRLTEITFGPDTPVVAPALIAQHAGCSPDMVEAAARRLGIQFQRTPGGWRRVSILDAQRLLENIQYRVS